MYEHRPHDQMSLLEAMVAGCEDITPDACRGWVGHAMFFLLCLEKQNIRCDVDPDMWPEAEERMDAP